jgi:hypothetical protein
MTESKKNEFKEYLEVVDEEFSIGKQTKEYNSSKETFVHPSAEELRALIWKLDLRIIPFLGLLYLCSFLDRVNIGNAKLAGITTDLNMNGNDYNLALSLFFVGYVSSIDYYYLSLFKSIYRSSLKCHVI